ncbi:hypothetical protein H9Q72_013254 [Fusarium xylarioides]|uniref:Enoyl-CoA hydratase n=1 Tax=Fusarium xylarioides TaxID=221167 RepID=A0A9P7LHW5_9HYPO|nr:hypothetical protein H9Q72_013254 [Fusarium xylarioides]KAG5802884.1 hypothetical protein H9Q71_012535 [Fusarium xylarioides]KAG5825593.1 hypothetical protein H9Q74_004326 [Fusarium xylarioides]
MGKPVTNTSPRHVEKQTGKDWVFDDALQKAPSRSYRIFRNHSAVLLEITRPENRNALTALLVEELRELYQRIAQDPTIFRIYLTGQGHIFCAGMNLSTSGSATAGDAETHRRQLKNFCGLLQSIASSPQVTIALINGPCYGGGNGLAFANDIRLCTRDATFNLSEVRLGLSPCAISPYLAREWGVPLLRRASLTGRPVTPGQLFATGAIETIVDNTNDLYGQALESLELTLQSCAPHASTACKELVHAAWVSPGGSFQDQVVERRYLEMMAPSPEAEYGIQQFRLGVKKIDWVVMGKTGKKAASHL